MQVRARGLSLPGYKKVYDSRSSSVGKATSEGRVVAITEAVQQMKVTSPGAAAGGVRDNGASTRNGSTAVAAAAGALIEEDSNHIADTAAASERWTVSGELVDAILRRREVKPFTVARELLPLLHRDLVSKCQRSMCRSNRVVRLLLYMLYKLLVTNYNLVYVLLVKD